MIFRLCSCIFLLQIKFAISAYAQVSVSEFLRSASEASEVKALDGQIDFLEEKTYRLPAIQKVEARVQNHEFLANGQEYALRVSPANPWEIKNNNRYFSAYQSVLTLKKELSYKEALISRYYVVINYLYYEEIRSLMQKNRKLLSDQLMVIEKQSGSSLFDADEYVALQVDQLEKDAELEEAEFDLMIQKKEAETMCLAAWKKGIEWQYNDIISPDRIMTVIDSLSTQAVRSTLLAYEQQKIMLANSAYNLERSNINLGFFQAQFDQRRVEQDRTPVNLSVGVTIPIANPNKPDMARRRMDAIEAKYALEETTSVTQLTTSMFYDRLKELYVRYAHLKNRIEALQNSNLSGTLNVINNSDPSVIIKYNQGIIKLDMLLAKIWHAMMEAYVDYLGYTDRLQQRPQVNYLSVYLEEF